MTLRFAAALVAALMLAQGFASAAQAQTYPSKTVTLVRITEILTGGAKPGKAAAKPKRARKPKAAEAAEAAPEAAEKD